jgi:hypothetical protein
MRHAVLALICMVAAGSCGRTAESDKAASATPPAAGGPFAPASLVAADTKARCAGFGTAEAAEILGVPPAVVTDRSQDITPISRGCTFRAGDEQAVNFMLRVDDSIEAATSEFVGLKATYAIAARAQEAATGKKIAEGAYSDILGVGDEAIWSVTNGSLVVRYRNLTILVISPSDKRAQVAVAKKVLEKL